MGLRPAWSIELIPGLPGWHKQKPVSEESKTRFLMFYLLFCFLQISSNFKVYFYHFWKVANMPEVVSVFNCHYHQEAEASPSWIVRPCFKKQQNILKFFFNSLKKGFSVYPWLSLDFLCRSGWFRTHRDPPATSFRVLESRTCATMPSSKNIHSWYPYQRACSFICLQCLSCYIIFCLVKGDIFKCITFLIK